MCDNNYTFQVTMHNTSILRTLLLLLLPLAYAQILANTTSHTQNREQECLGYARGNCISCPYNYHVNQNQCYLNITYCLSYRLNNLGQQTCTRCDASLSVSDGNGGCRATSPQLSSAISSPSNLQAIVQQYGDSRFQIISLQTAFADSFFLRCNTFMLTGEYTHFISRTAQPVQAVSYFSFNEQNQYRIIYQGSGGGLMMSIISISTINSAIKLNSFVPIATSNVIDYCGLYNEALQCVACTIGYHLQNNICYANIAGCISYSRNICLQCSGFSILAENRCMGCEEMADLAKVVFWGGLSSWMSSSRVALFSQNYLLAA